MNLSKIEEKVAAYKENPEGYKFGIPTGGMKNVYRGRHCFRVERRTFPRIGLNTAQVVEWFQSKRPDAEITLENASTRIGHSLGNVMSTNATIDGYTVHITVDGQTIDFDSTNPVMGRVHSLLDQLLPHVN